MQDHKSRPRHQQTPATIASQQHPTPNESQDDHVPAPDERTGDSPGTEELPKAQSENVANSDCNDELQEDFDMIFAEHPTKAADPVGIPLPHEYTDCPTIPPAYDATCIKSSFLREDNQKEFCQSIHGSIGWDFEHDPVFKRYPGMIVRMFPGYDHGYFTYAAPVRHPASAPIKLPPPFRICREALDERKERQVSLQIDRDRSIDHSKGRGGQDRNGYHRTPSRSGKRDLDDSCVSEDRASKRPRVSPNQVTTPSRSCQSSAQQATPQAKPIPDHDGWSPEAEESVTSGNGAGDVKLHRPPDRPDDQPTPSHQERGGRPHSSNLRHDSGYHSEQPQDKPRSSRRESESGWRREEWSYPRRHSHSRSPVGRSSRRSSPEDCGGRGRSNSPLTALEAELLGLSHPSESQPKKPTLKKPAKRQVKVASAFSRRW
ncbi:hypothetical protein QBC33DRAFT_554744 [Phialemonium atrogriseum]|uniref:Uncharacterized protein n=1 Tax=Phialemonium atrogriseum TaxID=1093897 RepID=A0AAJ0FKG5_9PEZI|nr:uncharacterized protein QBC33DRAFT_554744 [Phialemonium atrogriseum]KAK1771581.1 hypothetical protein QBC33DRAFT_554744 [Phialemonium atrogriseum]